MNATIEPAATMWADVARGAPAHLLPGNGFTLAWAHAADARRPGRDARAAVGGLADREGIPLTALSEATPGVETIMKRLDRAAEVARAYDCEGLARSLEHDARRLPEQVLKDVNWRRSMRWAGARDFFEQFRASGVRCSRSTSIPSPTGSPSRARR